MAVDNSEIIKPLLEFDSSGDDFYFLQILQRKKEIPNLGSNSKVVRNFYIHNLEYLEAKMPVIKGLCNVFNARAMLRLNKRSFKKVAFKTMQNVANSMAGNDFRSVRNSYDRACGLGHNDSNKKWLLDIDGELSKEYLQNLISYILSKEPLGDKIITTLPTKNGIHIITKPFDLRDFSRDFKEIEVHKDNPVNLYIP